MRVAIVGFGRIGEVHLAAWRSIPGTEVAAVCDTFLTGRRRGRSEGLAVYPELARMLAAERLDAVSVCTPPADHADVANACLEHGVHVLCEKPLAINSWQALKMLHTAARKRRQLLLATKFRHVRELGLARDIIQAGELGEPLTFEMSFCTPVDMSRRWNSVPHRSGGGVIIDNGCHAFDILSFLLGAVKRVHAVRLKPLQQLAVEDSASIQVEMGDGLIGRIDLSWSLSVCRDSYLVLHGSRGTLEIGWKASRLKLTGRDWQIIGGPYDKLSAQRRMHLWFIEAISTGREAWISARECLRTVAAVDAAYRSLDSDGWQWVEVKGLLERRTGT